jgi:phi13 family phage major tail protein
MENFVLWRGLENVHVAVVTVDDDGNYTASDPEKLIPAGEMTKTVDSEKTNVWFDNAVWGTTGREGATDVNISGAGLRAAHRAFLTGKEIDEETGAIIDSGDFVEKYLAVGGEAQATDGTKEYFWFLKGTFLSPDEANKTEDESTDYNGTELVYSAVSTVHKFERTKKKCKRVIIDTKTSKLKDDADWFAQVVTPDILPTICEKVIQ